MKGLEHLQTKKENTIEEVITHGGRFNTDEAFAEGVLRDLFPEYMTMSDGAEKDFVKHLRTRDKNVIAKARESDTTLIHDNGEEYDFSKFNLDHHQEGGAGKRENGVEYAAAGLVWKHFGKEWIAYIDAYGRNNHLLDKSQIEPIQGKTGGKNIPFDSKYGALDKLPGNLDRYKAKLTDEEIDLIWKKMDESYIQLIDANDTGQMTDVTYSMKNGPDLHGNQFTLTEMVRLLNVDAHDGRDHEMRFKQAVEMVRVVTLGMVNKYIDLVEGLRKFEIKKCEFSADNKTVIIDQILPPEVQAHLISSDERFKDVEFFAYKNGKGLYSMSVAPIAEGVKQYRNPAMFPQVLRGGNNTTPMNELIGVENGIQFAHANGFFAICNTKEAAKKFLELCESESVPAKAPERKAGEGSYSWPH